MKSELTLVFEETDGTLRWLFNILIYAHHVSEPTIRKQLEPMLKEFLHPQSYKEVIRLADAEIEEEQLINDYLQNDLVKFNSKEVIISGQRIKAMCFMIEQAGHMEEEANKSEDPIPQEIRHLFEGHKEILDRMKKVVIEALERAGAKGVKIDKFSSE
jgi:hypothetical protein